MKPKLILLSVLMMCTLSISSFSSSKTANSLVTTVMLADYEVGDFQDPKSGDVYAVYRDTVTGDITRIELMYGSDLVDSFAGSYVWNSHGTVVHSGKYNLQ